jgi:hypothetical protein
MWSALLAPSAKEKRNMMLGVLVLALAYALLVWVHHIWWDDPLKACSRSARPRHSFCIITRVRNYAEWIPEWIEYHRLLGASKIFIVDDCSQDNGLTQRVLTFYQSLKYVKFWEDVGPPVQPHCNDTGRKPHEEALFSFAFTYASRVCDWVAAIDVDEYISFDDTRINVSSVPLHKSIISTLSAHPNPWYKLAWWVILGQE